MQYHGSTNKSPNYLNAVKNKIDRGICLRIEKTTETKLHRVILRSPLLKIYYYQSQAVISIRNLIKPFGPF